MKCFKICSVIIMFFCMILAVGALVIMNCSYHRYGNIYKVFIICNYALIAVIEICNLFIYHCNDKDKISVRKFKVEKLTDVFCKFENIPCSSESNSREDSQTISQRQISEKDKEIFKAYTNAMADI